MCKCEICEKDFTSKRGLKNHIDKFHPDNVNYDWKCEVCNKGFKTKSSMLSHITKCHKEIKVDEYYNNLKIKCKLCGKVLNYNTKFKFGDYCNQQHYETYIRIIKNKLHFICEICKTGFEKIGSLQQHLCKLHPEINQEEYYKKYLLKNGEPDGKCLWCGKKVNFSSFTDGYNKFCYNSECNVKWYNKNTDRKEKASNSTSETYKKHPDKLHNRIEYWIKRGYSIEESKRLISEKQSTFSLKKCLNKYGKEEGNRIWRERQKKWLNSLKNKSEEELIRINKAKMGVKSFSKISQDLFVKIHEVIKNDFNDIYYATNGDEDNNEYIVFTKSERFRFLDFYIPSIKKCIEFDGDYWHGKSRGNKKRDEQREQEILETIDDIKILHVKEKDYKKNPEKIIQKCLRFLNE